MIEVRIRLGSEAHATQLCEWDAGNLDALIPTVERWGVETGTNTYGVTGTFVFRDGQAYFEVVVHDSDDWGQDPGHALFPMKDARRG